MSDFNVNDMKAHLQKDVKSEVLNSIKGYGDTLDGVNMYCENQQIGLSQAFEAYVMDDNRSDTLRREFMNPLIQESVNLNNRNRTGINGGLGEEAEIMAEKIELINDDMRIVNDKYDDTWSMYKESYTSTGDLAPMMVAKPPIQYLETIRNNGRLVIDHKVAENYTLRRKYERKYVIVDGEKRYFPEVAKDSAFLDKFLNHSQPEFKAEVVVTDATNGVANLISLSGVDNVNKDNDVLYPEVKITDIKVSVDGTEKEGVFLEDVNTIITQHNNSSGTPQFFIDTNVDGQVYTVGGRINFETGDITFNAHPDVVSFSVVARINGSSLRKVSKVDMETTPINLTIKERINMALSYDPKTLSDFATIENTDGLMKLTSIILDMSEHIKDHKVFKSLEDDKAMLAETDETIKRIATGDGTRNDYFSSTFYKNPIAGNNYRPGSPVGWREEMLPDVLDDILIEMDKKFNSKSGIKNVVYGDPRVTKLLPHLNTIISRDKEYAGVNVDYNVFTMAIQGHQIRVVSTERAKSTNELRVVPRSNDKEQETWTFYQHYSNLFKDGKIRDINNIHLPSIAYIDTFDVFGIHKVMGNILIDDEQKVIGDM